MNNSVPRCEPRVLLRERDGGYLGVAGNGTLGVFDHVDDKVVWECNDAPGSFRHVVTGNDLATAAAAGLARPVRFGAKGIPVDAGAGTADAAYFVERAPPQLPSQYLKALRENGWVLLPAILDTDTVEALERVACTGRWADRVYDHNTSPLNQDAVVAQVAAEPVSLWLSRQYLQSDDIRLAHPPSIAVLDTDDGKRDVQGWHCDYPYLWGSPRRLGGDRVPRGTSAGLVMGLQRNVCISPFTASNGATCFRLGSHRLDTGPPRDWGVDADYAQPGHRARHGLPYEGPETDVIEAPPGSIILYDARTWHRAGVNRTPQKRAAMLQALTPMYIMPFKDTSESYKTFVSSTLVGQLSKRQRREVENLLVHKIVGPLGHHPITLDPGVGPR